METLVLNGKVYVKASKAAKSLGYTSDYVGQLCRSKQVDAHLVGRSWYVDQEQLGEHRVEKKRMSRVKAREHAHKSIEEHRNLRIQESKNTHKNISISYGNDDNELIPDVRKLHIDATPVEHHTEAHMKTKEDRVPYTLENKGEKIVMSGKIKIRDASEDAIDEDTVVLTSHIERHRRAPSQQTQLRAIEKMLPKEEEIQDESKNLSSVSQKPVNFMERLVNFNVQTEDEAVEETEKMLQEDSNESEGSIQNVTSKWRSVLMVILLVGMTCASFVIESVWGYTINQEDRSVQFEETYRVDAQGTYQKMAQKLGISDVRDQ